MKTPEKALLSGEGPRGSFATFVEWVLVSCGSLLTIGTEDNDTSPTSNPVPSQKPSDSEEQQHEPTADREPDFTTKYEPAPMGAIERNFNSAPESQQVCKPAASSIAVGVLVVDKGMEVSPTHTHFVFCQSFCSSSVSSPTLSHSCYPVPAVSHQPLSSSSASSQRHSNTFDQL